jgi:aryl-alcohol dehydrogenase-like predicted oxidoreductase
MAGPTEAQRVRMEKAEIARTQLKVPRVAIGTWAIGGWMWGGSEERESISTILAAVDHGINMIDTAPAYGFGRSETIVGKAIVAGDLRSRVLIATKVGLGWADGGVFRDATRARILARDRRLLAATADRLHLYLSRPLARPLGAIEETADTMHNLLQRKKIRAIGVSNFSVEQMRRFRRVAPIHVLQSPYNLFEREIEDEVSCGGSQHPIIALG